MGLNGTTFIFEIINFLILIWILQRFLYRPVLNVIARRRQAVEQTLHDAEQKHSQAEALQREYQDRMQDWERQQQAAQAALQQEIAAQRKRLLAELDNALRQQRAKAEALEQRRQQLAWQRHETESLQRAARFATRLLSEVAGPEVEARLIDLTLTQLADWPQAQRDELRAAAGKAHLTVRISTAFELDTQARKRLQQTLQSLADCEFSCRFEQDPSLLAGLYIDVGPWAVRANLRDELKSFAESAYETEFD